MTHPLLTSREAAKYLFEVHGIRISPETLPNWRCSGVGPAFRRLGRAVLYSQDDLDAYVATRLSAPLRSTKAPMAVETAAAA